MTSLTKISSETKFVIKWGGIVFIVFLVIYFGIKIGKNINQKLHPTLPPGPTVSFGKLPPIKFPASAIDKKLTYSVDTLSGKLPIFPDRIKVLKINENRIAG